VRPARSQHPSFPEGPSLFFCSRSSYNVLVSPIPLQTNESEDPLFTVIDSGDLHTADEAVVKSELLITRGLLTEDKGDDVRELQAGPDIGNADERMGHKAVVFANASEVVVDGNTDLLLGSQALVEN
jgi:hypothetical protein